MLPQKIHLGNIMPKEEIIEQIKIMIDQEADKVGLTAKSITIE